MARSPAGRIWLRTETPVPAGEPDVGSCGLIVSDLFFEREAEGGKKKEGLLFILGGAGDGDAEGKNVFQILIGSFWKYGVLFKTKRDVTHGIDGSVLEPAEVALARDGHIDESVEEVVHPSTTQSDLKTRSVTGAE